MRGKRTHATLANNPNHSDEALNIYKTEKYKHGNGKAVHEEKVLEGVALLEKFIVHN
jgi:hypothetical protein